MGGQGRKHIGFDTAAQTIGKRGCNDITAALPVEQKNIPADTLAVFVELLVIDINKYIIHSHFFLNQYCKSANRIFNQSIVFRRIFLNVEFFDDRVQNDLIFSRILSQEGGDLLDCTERLGDHIFSFFYNRFTADNRSRDIFE